MGDRVLVRYLPRDRLASWFPKPTFTSCKNAEQHHRIMCYQNAQSEGIYVQDTTPLLLCICTQRKSNSDCPKWIQLTKSNSWDLAVSPTQYLVTTVIFTSTIERLQLRLGTDSTPSPYFHPPLEFWPPINVRALTLIQIDDQSVLQSIGSVLRTATRLKELTMWADGDKMLPFSEVSSTWRGRVPFSLTSLDLRGFVDFGQSSCPLWNLLSPVNLRALTLHVGPYLDVADFSSFWESSVTANLRPKQLSTNLVMNGLAVFIQSFSGLEAFSITSPSTVCVPERLDLLLGALGKQHSATLKVLSIDSEGVLADHLLDDISLDQIVNQFKYIEELRLGMIETVPVGILLRFFC